MAHGELRIILPGEYDNQNFVLRAEDDRMAASLSCWKSYVMLKLVQLSIVTLGF